MCLADVDSVIEHFLEIIISCLGLPCRAERDNTERHFRIAERIPPGRNHLPEYLVVHRRAGRTGAKCVVVSLVEDGTLDRQARNWSDHAAVTVARSVLVHRRSGAQVGRGLAIGGDLLAPLLPVGDPAVEILDAFLEVLFGIPFGNLLVPLCQFGFHFRRVDLFHDARRRPGLYGRPAARCVDQADGNLRRHVETPCKYITDRRNLTHRFRRADVPIAFAEMAAGPTAPFVKAREALFLFWPVLSGNGQDPDRGEIGGCDFEPSIFYTLDRLFHIALPAEDPDVANEDIIQAQRLTLPLNGQLLRRGVCLHRGERHFPRAVFGRAGRLLLAGEGNGYFFVRRRPAPDGDRFVALEDHVRLEYIMDTQPFTDGRGFDDVLSGHLLFFRRRRLGGDDPEKKDGQEVE